MTFSYRILCLPLLLTPFYFLYVHLLFFLKDLVPMNNCLTKFSIKALFQKSSHTGNAEFKRNRSHTLNLQLFERKGQDVFHLSPAFHQLRLSRHFTITLPSRRIEMQPAVFWWINKSVFAVLDTSTE